MKPITTSEVTQKLKSIVRLNVNIQEELSNLAIDVDNSHTYMMKLLDDKESTKHLVSHIGENLNERLNYILFLQDQLLNDVKSIKPVAKTLADESFFTQNMAGWAKNIKKAS